MYNSITSKYYWRTLYVDIGNFCRRCEKCTEVAVSGHRDGLLQDGPDDQGDDDTQKVTTLPTDRVIRVWKKVGSESLVMFIFPPFYLYCWMNASQRYTEQEFYIDRCL